MAPNGQSRFVQRVARATDDVEAVTGLLKQVAALVEQLVVVVGWLVLLCGSVALLFQTHPPLEHLVAPGAGALAVIQGRIATWLASRIQARSRSLAEPRPQAGPVATIETELSSLSAADAPQVSASDTTHAALSATRAAVPCRASRCLWRWYAVRKQTQELAPVGPCG